MKRVLVLDIGGTSIKVSMTGRRRPIKIPSGKKMTAAKMAAAVLQAVKGWKYDVVSIGFPSAVKNGKPISEPHNLSPGWKRFNYQ
jgi:polyphosphate glucokinase